MDWALAQAFLLISIIGYRWLQLPPVLQRFKAKLAAQSDLDFNQGWRATRPSGAPILAVWAASSAQAFIALACTTPPRHYWSGQNDSGLWATGER
jgi:hypothetical protein